MERAVTYLMAAVAGLVIALMLALPAMLSTPAAAPEETAVVRAEPEPPADTAATETAFAPSAPVPADNQTLVLLEAPDGGLTATVNGEPIGEMKGSMQVDISRHVRPGENTLRLLWLHPTAANIAVTYASIAGSPREVTRTFISPSETMQAGERTITFFL